MTFSKILGLLKGAAKSCKEALSERNGTASFGRWSAAFIIVNVVAWVWYIIIVTHGIMPDLAGATLFLTSGATATYGANKVASAIKGSKDKQDGPDSPAEGG